MRSQRGGGLSHATLRPANQKYPTDYDRYFEIVSFTGLVSIHGSHLHLSVSDEDGKTIGGHLGSGCKISTTAEIVVLAFENEVHKREFAEDSGYEELMVHKV